MNISSTEAEVIAELQRGHGAPPALVEFFKAHAARRKKSLLDRLKYRFRTVNGKTGVHPRFPNLAELAPQSSGGYVVRSEPPFVRCEDDYPVDLGTLVDSYIGIGFGYGSQEVPLLGPQRGDLHLWSVQTRAETGELSLAARVEPPDFPPQQPGIFLGADGTHVSGTLGQMYYRPGLPNQKVSALRATARIVPQDMSLLAGAAFVSNARAQYAAAVYGIATIELFQGINLLGQSVPSSSYWTEFFKLESPPGLGSISLLNNGYLDLNTTMRYVPNTTVLTVTVTFDVICAIQSDAVLDGHSSLLAWCNCRFADTGDKALAVIKDGGDGIVTGHSFAFRVSEMRVCGAPQIQIPPRLLTTWVPPT
jgi:hypothetical protein